MIPVHLDRVNRFAALITHSALLGRYCSASARCAGLMLSLPSRSAMVRELHAEGTGAMVGVRRELEQVRTATPSLRSACCNCPVSGGRLRELRSDADVG